MEKVSKRKIYYQIDFGKKNSKTIILLHALALNKSAMSDIYDFFLLNKFKVINIELRGHGNSTKNNCNKKIYIQECIKDVIDIIENEKIKKNIIIIGHSLGAIIASCLYHKYPNRFDKLVICMPLYRSPLKDQIINASFLRLFILIMTYVSCVLSILMNKKGYINLINIPQKTNLFFFKGLSMCLPKEIFNISNIIYSNEFDISNELKKIKNKVLIIGGENDFLVNKKVLNRINNLILNSKLKIYKGNHVLLYKNRQTWNDILNFIKR